MTLALGLAQGVAAQNVDVTVRGDSSDLTADMRQASLSMALTEDSAAKASDYLAAAQADYRRLLRALYDRGYYSGDISILVNGREAATIAPFDVPATVRSVVIRINPGPQFAFGRTQITPLPADAEVTSDFATGRPALAGTVRTAAIDAANAWRAVGHAKASVKGSDVTADHARDRLDVAVQMDPGPQLRFGRLSVSGTSRVRPNRVRAIAGLPEGRVYDPKVIDAAIARLRRTGTFEAVTFEEADSWTADYRLPITAQLSDRKPRRIGAGIEYATDDGLQVSGYWLHRNLLGGAERLRLSAAISNIGQSGTAPSYKLGAQFTRPATFGTDNTLHLNTNLEAINTPQYQLRLIEAYAGISREVNSTFTLSAGLGLTAARGNDGFGPRNYSLLTLPIKAANERRDDPKDARKGYYVAAELTPFWGAGGVGAGYRIYGDLRGYKTLGSEERVTLAGRVQAGSLNGVSGLQAPTDFLFYSGGGGTVRGQPFQSLGKPGSGGALGGNSFFGLQAEARVRVREKIGVVGFVDAGHVGDTAIPLLAGGWHAGAGIGVRYDSLIGPIRLDAAVPLDGANLLGRGQLYVGIGQAF